MPSFDRPRDADIVPSPWITRFAHLFPAGGTILDLACGHGRHTRWLAGLGLRVTATDIDVSGVVDLQSDPRVRIVEADLETASWHPGHGCFDGIVVTNYLHRPHFPLLVEALSPAGTLLVDTFAEGNERLGRPRNPDFLLAPGELLQAFAPHLHVVAYECGLETRPRPMVRQKIAATRAAPPVSLSGTRPG
jgi:SAM-dependent methyltransferase